MAADTLTVLVIVLLAAVFVLILLWALMVKIEEFKAELDYINMELDRATGRSRAFWRKKKRQLWLSLLPFYRAKR